MNRCPITYKEVPNGEQYSPEGLRLLNKRLVSLSPLPYSAEEQRIEAISRASKMSIQGVQPKLSAVLNVRSGAFEIVDTGGEFILKPQTEYPEVPQNEDLTMRLAESVSIEVPLHGLVYSKDGSFTYFIKRFDRVRKGAKLAVEDFAQLTAHSRDTKYDSSMEQVASTLDSFCTFPVVEKERLFRLTIFCYLTGNEDMHLKNFSLIMRDRKVELSPGYDLLNSTIILGRPIEEIALPLRGKKSRLTRSDLVDYYGRERLGLTGVTIDSTLSAIGSAVDTWDGVIRTSFLSDHMKQAYADLVAARRRVLGL